MDSESQYVSNRLSRKEVKVKHLRKIAQAVGIPLERTHKKADVIRLLMQDPSKLIPHLHNLPPVDLQVLREALDKSAIFNRALGFTFIALMFYILLIVADTTDLQLFLPESRVRLPIVDVELPLLGFYWVIPVLILIFHFHLLVNLKHHQAKYQFWREETGNIETSIFLDPILMNFLESYRRFHPIRILLAIVISFSAFFFPLINTVFIQWRFGAYHDWWISTMHFGATILDAYLVFLFFYQVFGSERYRRIYPNRFKRLCGRVLRWGYLPVAVGLLFGLGCWSIASYLEWAYPSKLSSIPQKWIPKIDITNSLHEIGTVADGYVLHYLKHSKNSEEAKTKALVNFGEPINLENRDLRFAQLDKIVLAKANLRGCRMDFASLNDAHLQECQFEEAHLYKTRLRGANLKGAFLNGADLEEASLVESNLEGTSQIMTDFEKADLRGANFRKAYMVRVNLIGANLDSSDFSKTKLIDVDFRNVELKSSNFAGSVTKVAFLNMSNIHGPLDKQK